MAGPRIGLVLGSGSARGWGHIGIIDLLIEAGIEPPSSAGRPWVRWSAQPTSLDVSG